MAYQAWYDNATEVQQQDTFTYTATTEQDFSWTNTQNLDIGVGISITEGVPDFVSSTQSLTVTLSMSQTTAQSITNTQTWTVNAPIAIPALSSVQCQMLVNTQAYATNYTATATISGSVAIWFNDLVALQGAPSAHQLWFVPIQNMLLDIISGNLADTTGYQVAPNGITVTTQGSFAGGQGINAGTTTTQYPLRQSVTEGFAIDGSAKKISPGFLLAV